MKQIGVRQIVVTPKLAKDSSIKESHHAAGTPRLPGHVYRQSAGVGRYPCGVSEPPGSAAGTSHRLSGTAGCRTVRTHRHGTRRCRTLSGGRRAAWLLEIHDGPFLELGLKGIAGHEIQLQQRSADRPDRDRLVV